MGLKLKIGDLVKIIYQGNNHFGRHVVIWSCDSEGYTVIFLDDSTLILGPLRDHEVEFLAEGYDYIVKEWEAEIERLQNRLKTNNSIIERAMSTINPNFNDLIIKNDKP